MNVLFPPSCTTAKSLTRLLFFFFSFVSREHVEIFPFSSSLSFHFFPRFEDVDAFPPPFPCCSSGKKPFFSFPRKGLDGNSSPPPFYFHQGGGGAGCAFLLPHSILRLYRKPSTPPLSRYWAKIHFFLPFLFFQPQAGVR